MLFCKERRERIAYCLSFKLMILSERAKSEWAKEQIPNPAKSLFYFFANVPKMPKDMKKTKTKAR